MDADANAEKHRSDSGAPSERRTERSEESRPATKSPGAGGRELEGRALEPEDGFVRSIVIVLALAASFAIIPRATRGCEGATALDEDAPNWNARIVANGDAVGGPGGGTLKSLDLSTLRGRPVVLDFWATWCGPCQAEAPIVNTIAQRYRDRGLAVVGVNTSDEDGLAAAFVKRKGLGFPIVFDEGNHIAKQYGVSSLPTLVVVSKTGKIVAIRHGVTSDADLDQIVRRYL